MNQRFFGRKSESAVSEVDGQLSLFDSFNEVEYLKQDSLKEPEITEVIIPSYHRKKAVSKRESDLAGLPARIIEHTLSDEELAVKFPDGYKELPEEVYKRLHIIPETFIVDEHHVHVYASKSNDGTILKAPRQRIFSVTVSLPLHLSFPSSMASIQMPCLWNDSQKLLKQMVSSFPQIPWQTG